MLKRREFLKSCVAAALTTAGVPTLAASDIAFSGVLANQVASCRGLWVLIGSRKQYEATIELIPCWPAPENIRIGV